MLFAVMPLRNALPDAPPIGSWIDVTVTLWVIAVLVISMLLFISCWRPEPNGRSSVGPGHLDVLADAEALTAPKTAPNAIPPTPGQVQPG